MLVMLVLYILTSAGILGIRPVGEEGSYGSPLIVPESYAFTIWAPIYLFLVAFPFYQLLKKSMLNCPFREFLLVTNNKET